MIRDGVAERLAVILCRAASIPVTGNVTKGFVVLARLRWMLAVIVERCKSRSSVVNEGMRRRVR